jgi:trimeric autotransporter adhesin
MDSDKEVTAVFEEILFDLTINITGNGTVIISPDLNEFEPGTLVELTAEPSDGWEFDQWEGDLTGTDNPASITMESSAEITASLLNRKLRILGRRWFVRKSLPDINSRDLQAISEFLGSHFIQVNNINASSTSAWNGGQGFRPIGSSSNPFTGTFNGNGFEISGLTIDRDGDDHVGLFGFIGNAQIDNTGLVNVNITGEDIVGGLAGTNNGQISNSYVTGIISGDEMVGGLVGANNGQITGSHSLAAVFGDDDHIGGLAGINGSTGKITNSFASGNVEADDVGTGGLVGTNYGEISHSYATGNVIGDESVGGLVGANRNNARIVNSYAAGSVSGDDEVGGLAGRNYPNGVIAASYASGTVSGDDETGGFIGWNQASLDSCYWDTQAANQSNGIGRGSQNGLTGLTTSEMTGSSAEDNMPGFNWNSVWRTSGNLPGSSMAVTLRLF